MKKLLRGIVVPLLVAVVAADCGDDDDMMGPGGNPPPDISGTYNLVSLTQAGITLTPPAVSGTFTATQTSSSASSATGDLTFSITTPVGPIMETGSYTIASDGTWTQDTTQQATGTAVLVGNTLTVTVTDPPVAASVSVWQRQ